MKLYVLVKLFINLEMIFLSCEPNIDDDLPGVFCFPRRIGEG
jgi:hypothetical protein